MGCCSRVKKWLWSSSQSSGSVPTTKINSFKRTNGFTWPPDKAQILTWAILLYFALAIFGCYCISLARPWNIIFGVLSGICFITHIALNITTMSINPGEEATLKKKISPVGEFDREKHKHVIENQFCNICQIVVSLKAKHCRRCNKCVTNFDHHCIYLNNCIGSRNYLLFILTIVTGFIGAMLIFIFGIIQFIVSFFKNQTFLTKEYFNQNLNLCNDNSCPDEYKAYPIFGPVSLASWRAFVMITALLALAAAILIGYLIGYHIFLALTKMTTYDHTIKLKERRDEKKRIAEMERAQRSSIAVLKAHKSDKLMERMGESNNDYFYHRRVLDDSPKFNHQTSLMNTNNSAKEKQALPPLAVSYTNNEHALPKLNNYYYKKNTDDESAEANHNSKYAKNNKAYSSFNDEVYAPKRAEQHFNNFVYQGHSLDQENNDAYSKFDYYDRKENRFSSINNLNPNKLAGLRNSNGSNTTNETVPYIADDYNNYGNKKILVEGNGLNNFYNQQKLGEGGRHANRDNRDTKAQTSNFLYNSRLPPINTVSEAINRNKDLLPIKGKNAIVNTSQELSELNGDETPRARARTNSATKRTSSTSKDNKSDEDDLVVSLRASRLSRRMSADKMQY